MDRNDDPAHIRVGINLGSTQDGITMARLMTTLNEVLARVLNLVRMTFVVAPIVVQCFYLHSVDFGTWLLRLAAIYVLIGITCFVAVPEQLYNGIGLVEMRWLFELFYPDIACCNGTLADTAERGSGATVRPGGPRLSELGGAKAKLRWHGTGKYLSFTEDGWAVAGDKTSSPTLLLQAVHSNQKVVPDTYTFRILDSMSEWHQAWLGVQPVNHLGFGGWLGAYRDPKQSCPYKVVQDTSCPPGACKLLCAQTNMPLPAQRCCTGFYLAERPSGGQLFVGHVQDREAALLELVLE